MTPEQFCYWLQGRAEMQPDNPPSAEEWKMIADHLQLVFKKETRERDADLGPSNLLKEAQDNIERQKRDRCWQQPPFGGTVGGVPQCGLGQPAQFGRNQPNMC